MQLPFELAGMDHPAHDLNTDTYRRLSPFEQIPSIDDDGWVLSESAASKHREFLVGWVNRVLTNLERWLAERDFVATKSFTVADILMANVLSSGIKDEKLIAPYPGVASYRDRCLARSAWKRTIEVYYARVEAG